MDKLNISATKMDSFLNIKHNMTSAFNNGRRKYVADFPKPVGRKVRQSLPFSIWCSV